MRSDLIRRAVESLRVNGQARAESRIVEAIAGLRRGTERAPQVRTGICISSDYATMRITAAVPSTDADGGATTTNVPNIRCVVDRLPVPLEPVLLLDAGAGRLWCLGGSLPTSLGWISYTPTMSGSSTNGSLGNGTLTGKYTRTGSTVHYRIRFVKGSTTTLADRLRLSLPVEPIDESFAIGHGAAIAAAGLGTTGNTAEAWHNSGDGAIISRVFSGGIAVNGSNPFAWATGDALVIAGTYEAD